MIAAWNDILYVVSEFNKRDDFADVRTFSSLEVGKEEFCTMMERILCIEEEKHENASHMGDYLPEEWMLDAIEGRDLTGWEEAGYPSGKAWIYSVDSNEVKGKVYEFDGEKIEMTLAHVCVLRASSLDSLSGNWLSADYARKEFLPFTKDNWEWNDGHSIRHYSIYPNTKESDKTEELWKVCVRTSLPNTCETGDKLKETVIMLDSFDDAKEIFQDTLKEYAFSKNAMFNGKGEIVNLKDYCEFLISKGSDDEGEVDDFDDLIDPFELNVFNSSNLYQEDALKIQEALKKAFSGETVDIAEYFHWKKRTDSMIEVTHEDGTLRISTGNDGYLNNVEPRIETNIFDMTEPKHYYLYLDDLIEVEASAELYMDIVKE